MGVSSRVLGKCCHLCNRLRIEQERGSVVLIRVVELGGLVDFVQVIASPHLTMAKLKLWGCRGSCESVRVTSLGK